MAQVCGGTSFDIVGERRHEAALKAINGAADLWAARGIDTLSVELVLAVVLRIYLVPWSDTDGAWRINRIFRESRRLEDWMRGVKAPEEEILQGDLKVTAEQAQPALDRLRTELRFAAEQWSLGDPEKPPAREVVNVIEYILWQRRIRVQPPTAKHPDTLLLTNQ
jgi:hypothetical protein